MRSDTASIDQATLSAIASFRRMLASRYGGRLRGVVLFGSRARGDHRPDSDADVAIFVDATSDPIAEQMDLAEDAYRVFLDEEILIQPWVFGGDPQSAIAPYAPQLLASVQREGIAL